MTLPLSITSFPYPILLYQAVNQVNGKKYIGITSSGLGKRVGRHFKTARFHKKGSAIGAAIRKYGQRNIKFEPIVVCPDWEYAKQLEVLAIEALKPGYNLTRGGDGCLGYKHTEEHKKYMSAQTKGVQHWLGKRHSSETIEKMRVSARKARAEGRGGFKKGHTINGRRHDRADIGQG